MTVLIFTVALAIAWILGLVGVHAPGAPDGAATAVLTLHWLLLIPYGLMFVMSGFMHTVARKMTAANIGWESSPFQIELGYVCYGMGLSAILASFLNQDTWIVLAIILTIFSFGASALHIQEMIQKKNYALGNTFVLISNFALPISLWALFFPANVL